MSEPASVSMEYIKMVNKEGSFFNDNNVIKRDLQNGKSEIISICINKRVANAMVSGLNLLDDNQRRWELE